MAVLGKAFKLPTFCCGGLWGQRSALASLCSGDTLHEVPTVHSALWQCTCEPTSVGGPGLAHTAEFARTFTLLMSLGCPLQPRVGAVTTALDATASGVYVVASTVDAGLNAKSELIVAATQGLLRLASRVPLVGHIAGALQDLFTVYQVSCTSRAAPSGSPLQSHPPARDSGSSRTEPSESTFAPRLRRCTVGRSSLSLLSS